MFTFLSILYVLVCLFLILVVLLQSGKGGGMGSAFGGGAGSASQQVFGGAGAGNILTRLTSISAALFMILSATLAYLSSPGDNALEASGEMVNARSGLSADGDSEAAEESEGSEDEPASDEPATDEPASDEPATDAPEETDEPVEAAAVPTAAELGLPENVQVLQADPTLNVVEADPSVGVVEANTDNPIEASPEASPTIEATPTEAPAAE